MSYLPKGHFNQSGLSFVKRPVVGVLTGTGVGPDVIAAALQVLESVRQVFGLDLELRFGGLIGEEAIKKHGQWLPDETISFCSGVFRRGGAILNGPGGGRYVYDLRRRFDLFCKFVPVRPVPELAHAGRVRPDYLKDVDLLIVRDNIGGVYQGQWSERATSQGRVAEHSFSYSEADVCRLIEVAALAAASRQGRLCVVIKDGGVPTVTALWRDVGLSLSRRIGVEATFMNVDLTAYELVQNPKRFDVIVVSNLFGDILADVCGLLVASRGVTFSGNFDPQGHGVYQTNHGSALDLAGVDVANPGGQILSLAMLLRESFNLEAAAALVEKSLVDTWRAGWRTADIAESGCRVLGTKAMGEKVAEQVFRSADAMRTTGANPVAAVR